MQTANGSGVTGVIALEDGWTRVRHFVGLLEGFLNTGTILSFSNKEYSETYTTVYNMCTQRSPYNWSEALYERYFLSMRDYLLPTVLPALRGKHDEYLLQEAVKRWENHQIQVKWMCRFFTYLDRYYVKHHSLPPLKDKGNKAFRDLIFQEVKTDLVVALLSMIARERNGESVERALIKSGVDIFIDMGMGSFDVYQGAFEEALITASTEYYKVRTIQWIADDTCPEYLEKAERALQDEQARVHHYLHRSSEAPLRLACEEVTLQTHITALLEKETGIAWLLANEKRDDLSRLYRLYARINDGLVPVAAAVKKHVLDLGNDIVEQRERVLHAATKDGNKVDVHDPSYVQSLLDLHDRYRDIVATCFGSHALFQKALKEAFEMFINRDLNLTPSTPTEGVSAAAGAGDGAAARGSVAARTCTTAELLSTFCDRVLKKVGGGPERLNEDATEASLKKVVALFAYLTDKDLFAEIYRNQLAKRLLQERSASDDSEKYMIQQLKHECGAQFTSKMEGMLTDLSLAGDKQRQFSDWLQTSHSHSAACNIELSVHVLTTGYWPTYKSYEVNLPSEMTKAMNVFKLFYDSTSQHQKKCLTWMHALGTAQVAASIANRRYDLMVSTLQACVLMIFADSDEWFDFSSILQSLGATEEVAKRLLHSLSCGKLRVLEKDPPDAKLISTTDRFRVNLRFTCPQRKIKIPMPTLEESNNRDRVVEDRSIAIEAAIVRIMKARKTLPHVQLVQEVLQQLAFFKPNPKVIKQRIEHLIEREYLERDSNAGNVYKYLA